MLKQVELLKSNGGIESNRSWPGYGIVQPWGKFEKKIFDFKVRLVVFWGELNKEKFSNAKTGRIIKIEWWNRKL